MDSTTSLILVLAKGKVMKRVCSVVAVLFAVMALASSTAWAQPGGRGGFRGGFGGFGGTPNLLDLAKVEAVQKELEALDDQVAGIKKLDGELSAARDAQRGQGQRPDFQNMSEAEREKFFTEMNARREKEATAANAKLGEILLPHQIERLGQISLQQSMRMRGMAVLADPKVAAKLSLTDDQKKKIEAQSEAVRSKMQEMFQGGNRDGMREKMEQMRKESDEKYSAVLTADQKAQFEKLKGAEFKMPEGAFGRGPGGRGGQGGQGRPQRPNN
jgi:Spy/CpxP family protein refolding chaperone